jgi:hypothetical protein
MKWCVLSISGRGKKRSARFAMRLSVLTDYLCHNVAISFVVIVAKNVKCALYVERYFDLFTLMNILYCDYVVNVQPMSVF